MTTLAPTTLTILPTYRCTAACEHCCFGSHPGIEERIPLDRILNYIDQAVEVGTVRLVVFSGGECFTLGDELVIAIAHATGRGLATRCVTNGYWAASEEVGSSVLDPLKRAGLTELNLSTGDFHQKFVPPSRVVNGALAAVKLGIRVVVVVESRVGREFSAQHLLTDKRVSQLVRSGHFEIIESPWISMDDREAVSQPESRLAARETLHLQGGCDSVLSTFVVTPSEELGACCGLTREQIPEMNVGSLRASRLADLVADASRDLLKMWIAVEGPARVLEWAASKDSSIKWEGLYAHHCDSCRALYSDPKVRRVIRSHYGEKEEDIRLRFALQTIARSSEGSVGPVGGSSAVLLRKGE